MDGSGVPGWVGVRAVQGTVWVGQYPMGGGSGFYRVQDARTRGTGMPGPWDQDARTMGPGCQDARTMGPGCQDARTRGTGMPGPEVQRYRDARTRGTGIQGTGTSIQGTGYRDQYTGFTAK